jgi:SAM-dependent methyltransferase
MFSVSKKRWRNAQDAEKESFSQQTFKKLVFESEFFFKNFRLNSDFFSGKDILEVGCSPAAIIHGIYKARIRLGVEPLADTWGGFYEKSTVHVKAVGEYLPVLSESIDAALCINVLDHVQVPTDVLNQLHRSLKKGGVLLLWLQTFSIFESARRLLGRIDTPHPHHFNDAEVFSLLKASGYKIVFHQCRRANIHSPIFLIKSGMFASGIKSLLANVMLRLHESSFLCIKTS